jgi:hypothetical protein
MAGGGYRGILAAVPTAQNLRSASRGGVHRKSKTRRPTGRPVCSTLTRPDRSHAPRGNAAGDALRPAVDAGLESCAMVTRSVTGCIPTWSVGTIRTRTAFAPHHSSGRALARLALLILICRVGRPNAGSAQWATRHGCRVSRPGPTEQDRSEGMPSLGEAPDVRGKSAWLLGALPSDPPSGRNQ